MASSTSPPRTARGSGGPEARGPAGRAPARRDRRRGAGPWSRLPTVLRRALLFAALVGVWQLYVVVADVSPLVFSSPWEVAVALAEGWGSGALVGPTLTTLRILGLGMAIGMALALALTALAVATKAGDDVLSLLTAMINPLPSVAVLPLAMLWFGLNETALVFVVANAVLWPLAVNLGTGFRTVPQTTLMVGRSLGLRGWRLIRDVHLPSALPATVAGIKTGWAFGWRTIIAAELVFGVAGAQGGLGFFINNARFYLDIPDVFAGLVTIAVIGIALDLLFSVLERQTVVRWGMKQGATT
ncbi:ABC transporter permease [Marinitenerispora sediminis]|uniref:ABC transporter permease n=1 Tax=Marinitenerispora sediminis TaxID=1931232 RepID=A0A368SZ64_9ACTN|nr:ABC transporter permease [Marinitenerispora sediminis]RCV50292.1 ABC transporter permease [Marinitenerispora sediminis]RCV53181.1 ABC transporter permease [Marinitenerispora sediminis]